MLKKIPKNNYYYYHKYKNGQIIKKCNLFFYISIAITFYNNPKYILEGIHQKQRLFKIYIILWNQKFLIQIFSNPSVAM
jgi:hypothetical protein